MRLSFAALMLFIPSALLAQDWVMRSGDALLDQAALDARLRGQIITFYDDGQSRFFDDGRYTYTYANDGGTAYGYFEVGTDSTVCIEFVHGFSRCDLYVMDGARLVLITEKGQRFPIRP